MAGIEDATVIDLVAQDASGEYVVVMVEERPWGSDPDQLGQLKRKINAYAGYILHGGLVRQYPETTGRPRRVQLDCVEPPPPLVGDILDRTANLLAKRDIGFKVNVRA